MQRDRRRQDDEIRGEVRVEHAAPGIPAYTAQFAPCGARIAYESRRFTLTRLHFLDLFGRLPEEQVRTDGRAEHTDYDGGRFGIELDIGPHGVQCHLAPGDVNRE